MNDTPASLRTVPSPVNPWLALGGWLLLTAAAGGLNYSVWQRNLQSL